MLLYGLPTKADVPFSFVVNEMKDKTDVSGTLKKNSKVSSN